MRVPRNLEVTGRVWQRATDANTTLSDKLRLLPLPKEDLPVRLATESDQMLIIA